MRCAPMSRPASKPSGRGVVCLKATSRPTKKASATRSTGTPASCSRKAPARQKGPTSSPERPHAFIGSAGSADGPVGGRLGAPLRTPKARIGGCAENRRRDQSGSKHVLSPAWKHHREEK